MPATTPDLPARLLGPHVLIAHCPMPAPAALHEVCSTLRSEIAQGVPVHVTSNAATAHVIVAEPHQLDALISYLKYLQALPASALDDRERTLLEAWCP
ncbi:hypothetical protein [Deinococcus sp. ME38]|uniref:hypothetical protein n=1 Tax=Deinococcus sp. ME38 TaxID=3400344 RepID=UPI003B5CB72E